MEENKPKGAPEARSSTMHIERLEPREMLSAAVTAIQPASAQRAAHAYVFELENARRLVSTSPLPDRRGPAHQPPLARAAGSNVFSVQPLRTPTSPHDDILIAVKASSTGPGSLSEPGNDTGFAQERTTRGAHVFSGRPPQRRPRPLRNDIRRHVLVVEDEPGTRIALAKLLQHKGWKVSTAGTVGEAIGKLSSRPSHVLVDLILPDGDGAALLQYVQARRLPIRVTVTTGVSDPEQLERVRKLGPESVLTKPLNVEELMEHLSAAQ